MPIVYQDIYIKCNFGLPLTTVIDNQPIVQTSNDSVRFLVEFPAKFLDYIKTINITYLSSSAVDTDTYVKYPTYGDWSTGTYTTTTVVVAPVTETYDMTYDNVSGYYYFLLDRKFLYFDEFKTQFSARLGTIINGSSTTQMVVDASILYFRIKKALKTYDLQIIDADPTPEQSIILQEMVDAHAAKIADIYSLGHVKADGETTIVSPDGTLTLVPSNGTVIQQPDGSSYVFTIGTIAVPIIFTELCRMSISGSEVFRLSYIGISTTQDMWFHLRIGSEIISSEMIAAGGMHNQFMYPYGFITVSAVVTEDIILEAKAILTNSIATGEFCGGITND